MECLSAYLKMHGHETDLAFDPQICSNVFFQRPTWGRFFSYRKRMLEQIQESNPDVVAFSVTGYDLPWSLDVAIAVKERTSAKVVFGGTHAWICPDLLMKDPAVDFLVQGEGEEPLLEILRRMEIGDLENPIPNTWHRYSGSVVKGQVQPPSYELDDLPFPDKDLFYSRMKHLYGYVMTTSRICLRGCSFCFYNVLKKLYYAQWLRRRRSAAKTLSELEHAVSKYQIESVRFYDNDIAEDIAWLTEFADGYAERIFVPYHAITNPSSLTPDAVELLRKSGCFEIEVGVQTVYPKTRHEIGRFESLDVVRDAVDRLQKAGIRTIVDLIFGLPGEGQDDAIAAGKFFSRHRPTKVNILWLDYYPKSDLSRLALKKGVLKEQDIQAIDKGEWMAGYTGGKTMTGSKELLRMHALLALMLMVSEKRFEFICRHRLYRLFPPRIAPTVLWILLHLMIRHPRDLHRIRYYRMHKEFVPKIFGLYVPSIMGLAKRNP